MMKNPLISIVLLSFNRPELIYRNVNEILDSGLRGIEVIVIDNCSEIPVSEVLRDFDGVRIIRLEKNVGVAGRNIGILEARAEYVITLDDDVFGITGEQLDKITNKFDEQPSLGAINFKVIDDVTEKQVNWCHHRKVTEWGDRTFQTYEISEGAVAFRRSAVIKSGLYPEYFFISHEGPDLAIRIMDSDFEVIYLPNITVKHSHAKEGRPSWRRYYYDSRNVIWLALRCYPLSLASKRLLIDLSALMIYAVRDGFFTYWLKGVFDAVKGAPKVMKDRTCISKDTLKRYRIIEKNNPSFFYMLRKRIFQKEVKI